MAHKGSGARLSHNPRASPLSGGGAVLHVIAEMGHGGGQRVVETIAIDLVARQCDVVVASDTGEWYGRLRPNGVRYVRLPLGAPGIGGTMRSVSGLTRLLRSERVSVIHAHNVRASAVAATARLCAGRIRVPVICTIHGLKPGDYKACGRILRLLRIQHIVACSTSVRELLRKHGVDGKRLSVIENAAVVPALPEGTRKLARLKYGLPLDRPMVLGVGRLVEQKRWDKFIEVAGVCADVDFVVAGDGPLRYELEALGRHAGVRFLGYVDDAVDLMHSADCVLFTSDWEGYPIAMLESIGVGTPVVTTPAVGLPDDLPVGAARTSDDPETIAASVCDVLNAPRPRLSSEGTSGAYLGGSYISLYQEVARGR